MKKLLYFLSLTLILGCDEENTLLFENEELNGVAYLKDPMLETNAVILPAADIYLYNGDATKNYIQKTTADKNGIFRFIFQPETKENIHIVSEHRDSASLLYKTNITTAEFKDSLILTPQYAKGLLKIRTLDADDRLIGGITVYVFNNVGQALAALKGSPTGAIRAMKSNDKGIAFFHNLEIDDYFVVGKKDSANATKVRTVKVQAGGSGETRQYNLKSGDTLITVDAPFLLPLFAPPVDYSVTVRDSTSLDPLPGVEVYVFKSIAQAKSVKKEAAGYVVKQKTGIDGVAQFKNIPEGSYYFASNGKFMGSDSLVVKWAINSTSINFPITSTDPEMKKLKLFINTH